MNNNLYLRETPCNDLTHLKSRVAKWTSWPISSGIKVSLLKDSCSSLTHVNVKILIKTKCQITGKWFVAIMQTNILLK